MMVPKNLHIYLLFGLVLVLLLFSGITHPVPIRTEGLRIAIAEEMSQSGNWVVPHLWGEPILTKPPGFYWALSLAQWVGGTHSLVVLRLVSILALGLIAFAANTYCGYGAKGHISGFIFYLTALGGTLASLGQVPSAEMDIAFSFWILWFWMVAIDLGKNGVSELPLGFAIKAIGLGLVGGLAVLFKWTAPAFFLPAWLWIVLFSKISRSRKIQGSILCGLGILIIPFGWMAALLAQVEWRVFRDAVMAEALPHLSPAHHTRAYPFLEWVTFPLQIMAMALPAALPLALPIWSRKAKFAKLMMEPWPFVLAGSLLIWTLIPGHRPRHALPIAFGLAILSVPLWKECISNDKKRFGLLFFMLFALGIAKLIYSVGTANQRSQQSQLVKSAGEMQIIVGSGVLGLDRIKEDGFVWMTRISNVVRISDDNCPDFILCDQNQKEKWTSKGYSIRAGVELSRYSSLTLLSKEAKP